MYSATQLRLFRSDPDAWAARYIYRRKSPVSSRKKIGAAVHRTLAEYLRGGRVPAPPGPVFRADGQSWYPDAIVSPGLHLLPAPGSSPVERRVVFSSGRHKLVAILDVLTDDWTVIDHKTCAGPDDAMTSDQLVEDVQAQIYAGAVLSLAPSLDPIALRWVYYYVDGSGAHAVEASLSRPDLVRAIATVAETCDDMERWYSKSKGLRASSQTWSR